MWGTPHRRSRATQGDTRCLVFLKVGRVRTQQGYTTMAKRRKFLAGLGALASGSAAAVGTGAFSTMSSGSRTTNVQVTEDANSFIGLEGVAPWANGDSTDGGKLALDFSGAFQYGYNREGINPGSTYTFDDVFRLQNGLGGKNADGDKLAPKPVVYIEVKNFDEDVDIDFYISSTGNFSGKDSTPRLAHGTSITGEQNSVRMNVPETFWIGVEIKSTGSTSISEAGGDIIIHAAKDGYSE